MNVLSFIGILIAIACFMYFGYKGYHILVLGICAAVVVCLFGQMPIVETLTATYMTGFVGYMKKQFFMFLGGALFGRLMSESGAANRIAMAMSGLCRKAKSRRMQRFIAIMSLPLMNLVITYGGISSFLCVFVMVAVAKDLFEELDIPWKLYGFASFGSATITSGFLPGSPQVTNVTPTTYLGTTAMAGATLGIICSIFAVICCVLFCFYEVTRFEKIEEGFLPSGDLISKEIIKLPDMKKINLFLALLPCIVLLVVLNVLKQNVIVALAAGIVTVLVLFWKNIDLKKALTMGVPQGTNTVCAVCAAVGFGSVVAASPGYQFVIGFLDKIPGNPAFQIWIAVNMCSFVCGSSQSGVGVALQTLGERFLSTGLAPETIHRLCSISACGLDTMPHSIGVINACTASKLNHKQIYYYFFVLTVAIPLLSGLLCAALISVGIGC